MITRSHNRLSASWGARRTSLSPKTEELGVRCLRAESIQHRRKMWTGSLGQSLFSHISACSIFSHAGSWLDCAHTDYEWVCFSQPTDPNVNLLWQHPHRHNQDQYFVSFNLIKLTVSINHLSIGPAVSHLSQVWYAEWSPKDVHSYIWSLDPSNMYLVWQKGLCRCN